MKFNSIDELALKLAAIKVVPVIALDSIEDARRLAEILVKYGLLCAEVTFRTPQAAKIMEMFHKEFPSIILGAGTVLTVDQVDSAIKIGADFVVSPGLNPEIVKYAKSKNIPHIPGINCPTHVEQGMALGVKTFKFFPAEVSGGTGMLKALSSVYDVKFMPTGGITRESVSQYLSLKSVFCCGGSWLVSNDLIKNKNWQQIESFVEEVSTF